MKYRLFMDTNIYEIECFNFHSSLFESLKNIAQTKDFTLVINSIIKEEVLSHTVDNTTKAMDKFDKLLAQREFSPIRNISKYKKLIQTLKPDECVETCKKEFLSFLKECNTEYIPLGNLDIEKIMDDYFRKVPPFENKKPNEFKDAFIIKSLLKDIKEKTEKGMGNYDDELCYCVVSNDKGFCTALKNGLNEQEEKIVKIFDNLASFIDYVINVNKQSEFLKEYLLSDYGREFIKLSVDHALCLCDFIVEVGYKETVETQNIEDIEIEDYTPYIIGLTEEDGKQSYTAKIALEITCIGDVSYEYVNEDESYYDKEDQEYLWKTMTEIVGSYEFKIELSLNTNINKGLIPNDWDKKSASDKQMYLENCSIQILGYLDAPLRICLYHNDLKSEIRKEYTDFPDFSDI